VRRCKKKLHYLFASTNSERGMAKQGMYKVTFN
jgi:hypothetical protein